MSPKNRPLLQAVLGNTGWLLFEKALRLLVGLAVTAWVARYLGPEEFGLFNYALALIALLAVLANAGLDLVVVRNLVRQPQQADSILGSAFFLKALGSAAAVLLALAAALLLSPADTRFTWIVLLLALSLPAQAFDPIDLWFRANLQSRHAVIARNGAFLAVSIARVLLIFHEAPVIAFAWAVVLESWLAALGLITAYRLRDGHLLAWRAVAQHVHELAKQCWPLLLSGVMVGIYLRIDQVMLGRMLGSEAVGIYSAGIFFSELWYVIPSAIVMSMAPVFAKTRDADPLLYQHQLERLFRWLALASYAAAATMTLISNTLVILMFGEQYAEAAGVLAVHAWTGVFVALGVASSQYLMLEDLNRISLQRTTVGALLNVVLNLLLIPRYGPMGAAWATLLSYAVATLFLIQNEASRKCLKMLLRALVPFKWRAA
jgi:polysaccharide transporter, PST family